MITLTAEQAAKLLKVSRRTVFNMLKDGRLHDLSLPAIIAYVRERAYADGRRSMLEELRRGGWIRRRNHHLHRLTDPPGPTPQEAPAGPTPQAGPSPLYPPPLPVTSRIVVSTI